MAAVNINMEETVAPCLASLPYTTRFFIHVYLVCEAHPLISFACERARARVCLPLCLVYIFGA